MREVADAERIARFMRELGRRVHAPVRVYFTGGTSAVLLLWRASTIDVDVKFVPDSDEIFRAIPELKESLRLNVELASPDLFIPELPGWRERSRFIGIEGSVEFFHYDFYAQALAKIERGHEKDMADVRRMFESGLVLPRELIRLFEAIEPALYRYPAIDPATFRRAVIAATGA
jgi:hypothetical protein